MTELEKHHQIWDLYGELLYGFGSIPFTAKEVSKMTLINKKEVNQILHILIHEGVVQIVEKIPTKATVYKLVNHV